MTQRRLNREDVPTAASCSFCHAPAPFMIIPRTRGFGDVRHLPSVCGFCGEALGLFAEELSTDMTEWMAVEIELLFDGDNHVEFFTW